MSAPRGGQEDMDPEAWDAWEAFEAPQDASAARQHRQAWLEPRADADDWTCGVVGGGAGLGEGDLVGLRDALRADAGAIEPCIQGLRPPGLAAVDLPFGDIWPIPIFGDQPGCGPNPLLEPLGSPAYACPPSLAPISCPTGLSAFDRQVQMPFSARCFSKPADDPWPEPTHVRRTSASAPNRRAQSFGSPDAIGLTDAALDLGLAPGSSMRIDGAAAEAYWAIDRGLLSPTSLGPSPDGCCADGALSTRQSGALSGEGATSSQSSGTPVGSRVGGSIRRTSLKKKFSPRGGKGSRAAARRRSAEGGAGHAAAQQPSVGSSEVDGVAEGSVLVGAGGEPEGQALDSPPKDAKAGRARGKAAQKTSQYNGVSKHRRSGRWEAHIWVNDFGRQIYLGGFDVPEDAAAAYDMVAIKSKGLKASTNFDVKRYLPLWDWLQTVTLPELVTHMRRRSKGFSRGTSKYRGVTRHPTGRWESRIGVHGSRHIYLGLYPEEESAARHYDRALVRLRGVGAATNFSLSGYLDELSEHKWMKQMATDRKDTLGTTKYNKWVRHGGMDAAIFA